MSGIFDIFRRRRPRAPAPSEERGIIVPPAEAPRRGSFLELFRSFPGEPSAAPRPEERGVAVRPEAPLRRGGFWEIFRAEPPAALPAFPAARPEPGPPAPLEPPTETLPSPFETFFAPAPPIEEEPSPPAEPERPAPEAAPGRRPQEEPRYTFIRVPRVEEGWTLPSPEEMVPHLREHFQGLEAMFQDLRELRSSSGFKRMVAVSSVEGRPVMVRVDPVVYREFYTDMATLLDIPWNVMESHLSRVRTAEDQKMADVVLMRNVIEPMLQRLTEAFDLLKPPDLPGWFAVDFDDETGEWWLFYVETVQSFLPSPEGGERG